MAREPLLNFPETELVIGLVGPLGTGLRGISEILVDRLVHFGYEATPIVVSELIEKVTNLETNLVKKPEFERLQSFMDAGNELRGKAQRGDYLALSAIAEIAKNREKEGDCPKPKSKYAYILRSLKHPDEVMALREVYGAGFFLLGVNAPRESRLNYLINDKGISKENAENLIARDEHEDEVHGQQTREAFELADAFIATNQCNYKRQIWRILDLLFGHPYITPTFDEYAMFLAYAASLRSADLSRQVGAVIRSKDGEIISAGANDVPRYGGGLYWPDELPADGEPEMIDERAKDRRDYRQGYDSNARRRNTMIVNVARKEQQKEIIKEEQLWDEDPDGCDLKKGKDKLEGIGVTDITEYSRAVHAEMEALLAAARNGINPRGATLFCTTFPCHNCAKHIVAAGVCRVIYVEPYPKSQAIQLHDDSIGVISPGAELSNKVRFEPFVGVGPRRYLDLFSLTLSAGKVVKRNDRGRTVLFDRCKATPRIPLLPIAYLQREKMAVDVLEKCKQS